MKTILKCQPLLTVSLLFWADVNTLVFKYISVWPAFTLYLVCQWLCAVCIRTNVGRWGATQAVQTSTRWMQSWGRRWWPFGPICRRSPWTSWWRHTRVSCGWREHSDVRVSDHLTKRTASPSQCRSLLCISWPGHNSRNTPGLGRRTQSASRHLILQSDGNSPPSWIRQIHYIC